MRAVVDGRCTVAQVDGATVEAAGAVGQGRGAVQQRGCREGGRQGVGQAARRGGRQVHLHFMKAGDVRRCVVDIAAIGIGHRIGAAVRDGHKGVATGVGQA